MYDSMVPTENAMIINKSTFVTCELPYLGTGPPEPELVTLEVLEGNLSSICEQNFYEQQCDTWENFSPLKMKVFDNISEKVTPFVSSPP